MQPIPVAILGASGYAGETALRIVLGHPGVRLVHVGSDRLAGRPVAEAVPSLAGLCNLTLAKDDPETIITSGAQCVILAKKSPEVTKVVPALLKQGVVLIDIGAEFRLRSLAAYQQYYGSDHACPELLPQAVYGLSETHTEAIRTAQVIGNPGCYPTSMLLPLIPLLRAGLIDTTCQMVSVSYSGLSGAGKSFVEKNNNLFWACNENLHAYKALSHQHVGEVDQELSAAAGTPMHLHFVPHLAPITRGMLSTISLGLRPGVRLTQVQDCWQQAYAGRPFIRLRPNPQAVEVAHVSGSNCCDFAGAVDGQTLVVCSAIDNLVKGASGQAVQNLNLRFGLPEDTGLRVLSA